MRRFRLIPKIVLLSWLTISTGCTILFAASLAQRYLDPCDVLLWDAHEGVFLQNLSPSQCFRMAKRFDAVGQLNFPSGEGHAWFISDDGHVEGRVTLTKESLKQALQQHFASQPSRTRLTSFRVRIAGVLLNAPNGTEIIANTFTPAASARHVNR